MKLLKFLESLAILVIASLVVGTVVWLLVDAILGGVL
jgi:hypothetical protein